MNNFTMNNEKLFKKQKIKRKIFSKLLSFDIKVVLYESFWDKNV